MRRPLTDHERVIRVVEDTLWSPRYGADYDILEWVDVIQGRDLVRRYLAEGGELDDYHRECLAKIDAMFEQFAEPAWRAIKHSHYDLSNPDGYWHHLRRLAEGEPASPPVGQCEEGE